jgi:hypothetical protein
MMWIAGVLVTSTKAIAIPRHFSLSHRSLRQKFPQLANAPALVEHGAFGTAAAALVADMAAIPDISCWCG